MSQRYIKLLCCSSTRQGKECKAAIVTYLRTKRTLFRKHMQSFLFLSLFIFFLYQYNLIIRKLGNYMPRGVLTGIIWLAQSQQNFFWCAQLSYIHFMHEKMGNCSDFVVYACVWLLRHPLFLTLFVRILSLLRIMCLFVASEDIITLHGLYE